MCLRATWRRAAFPVRRQHQRKGPGLDRALNAKVEVKNMNSFRSVYRALGYEFERHVRAVSEGLPVYQETRGWVEDRGVTVSQRSKEYAHDYRYFPEPDLPAMKIDPAWVEEIRARLPRTARGPH